jgi:hypothetical protein
MTSKLKLSVAACALSLTLLNSGCATIFGHSNYLVTINSNPAEANITITDRKGVDVYKGPTPATVKLKSSSGYFSRGQYQVKYHLAGYDDKTVTIDSKLNGWYIGNILIGGLVGMLIVDPASGAMYKITDTTLTETLVQSKTAQVSELKVIDINNLSVLDQTRLVKIN